MFVQVLTFKYSFLYANNTVAESEGFDDQNPKPIKIIYFIWPTEQKQTSVNYSCSPEPLNPSTMDVTQD